MGSSWSKIPYMLKISVSILIYDRQEQYNGPYILPLLNPKDHTKMGFAITMSENMKYVVCQYLDKTQRGRDLGVPYLRPIFSSSKEEDIVNYVFWMLHRYASEYSVFFPLSQYAFGFVSDHLNENGMAIVQREGWKKDQTEKENLDAFEEEIDNRNY